MHRVPRLLTRTASPCWTARITASNSRAWSTPFVRRAHTRRELPYSISEGLGDFLSPEALQVIAVDYQEGLLQRLNEQVKGTDNERTSIAQTVINTATDRSATLAFTYASRALNNSYFLENLKPPPSIPEDGKDHEGRISQKLRNAIREQYGEVTAVKSTVGATALGMSSGYVWLVTDKTGELGVLPTFAAGTMLVRAREQRFYLNGASASFRSMVETPDQSFPTSSEEKDADADDFNFEGDRRQPTPTPTPTPPFGTTTDTAPTSPTSGISHEAAPFNPSSPSRQFSTSAVARQSAMYSRPPSIYSGVINPTDYLNNPETEKQELDSVGEDLFPLFCVSVNEHAWMAGGYGVWGQEEYLKRFWTVLDWAKVSQAYAKFAIAVRRSSQY
ncbi:hypothetical protein PUNSTDRAFT_50985 [Punctularia strigosozonata HHB-11173 SS5]|uniref:uncharacterized protein n=1 Tax=Punctularia strigosozonata (strain HHB-11173) TaxID=741275 RepID=UPI0004417012|nr:uncharacterized protein PUNSTDRAFT_50985 [Punctularia strigosozonata HHB-11173 SS5]EIN10327.1 hypothetical protein PUNSTDRAFT_50985 [Punctularia strigosozonata HHB-11173 SS5]